VTRALIKQETLVLGKIYKSVRCLLRSFGTYKVGDLHKRNEFSKLIKHLSGASCLI
jgi:hypothetical protein